MKGPRLKVKNLWSGNEGGKAFMREVICKVR